MRRRASVFLALLALCSAQPTPGGGKFWVAEGGDSYRTAARALTGSPPSQARLFYAKLGDCVPRVEGTAAATPLHYSTSAVSGAAGGIDFILQPDCANNLRAFVLPDTDARLGGALTLLWTWSPPSSGPSLAYEPLLTTPVIVEKLGIAVFVHKGTSRLHALDITTVPPTELAWSRAGLTLCNLLPPAVNLTHQPNFCTWSEDHALTFYNGKVWIPSGDYFGALLVDPATGAYSTTRGLGDNVHRFLGSAGGRGGDAVWTAPLFNTVGATYGVTALNGDGSKLWQSAAVFESYRNEFAHPVSITLDEYACVITSEASFYSGSFAGLFISGTDSETGYACGDWAAVGYYIRHPAIGNPQWVSAPAVIYDGSGTVFLAFALNRQSGGGGSGRSNWRAAVVLLQLDRTGVYEQPVEFWDLDVTHLNAAPIVLRNAFGAGVHGIGVATSHGEFLMFKWRGFTQTGPAVVHSIVNSLPAPAPYTPGASVNLDPSWLSADGNYMMVTNGGTFAVVSHNAQTEEMYLQVLVGASAPALASAPAAAAAGVNVAAAVFGTAGALALAAAAVVVLAPRAGFSIGATRVVPAELIKGAALGAASGAAWLGSAAYGLVADRGTAAAQPAFSSSYKSSPAAATSASAAAGGDGAPYVMVHAAAGERASLMR